MVWQLVIHYFSFLSGMITTLIALCTVLSLICALLFMTIRTLIRNRWRSTSQHHQTVGFFHPYCNAGGGGERVLWCAIRAVQNKYRDIQCVVYTGDTNATPTEIVTKVRDRFNISLPRDVKFVYLSQRKWVEARTYPHFTLLGQSVGSMLLALEALLKFAPDVFLDTMGYAFAAPIFKYLGGCQVGCYVHYPTVSSDMLQRVTERRPGLNNSSRVTDNRLFSYFKVLYYRLFAVAYGLAGRCTDAVMVNSSWTRGHILQLWRRPAVTFLLCPPCDVADLRNIPLTDRLGTSVDSSTAVVSVGQFRPEKDHELQIRSFQLLLSNVGVARGRNLRLRLVGGCRNEEDEARVAQLQQLCRDLEVADRVDFLLNVSFAELRRELAEGLIGLHTMWNEHFGIGVVEGMAAGLVTVAHDSGGPKMDIVTEFDGRPTGLLASNAHDFAAAMEKVLTMKAEERLAICENARKSTARFSESVFETNFLILFETFFLSGANVNIVNGPI